MKKVILFIAMSLDGYIADKHGGVSWLNGEDKNIESADTYTDFIKHIDTVIMGWNTYEQIVTELSPKQWIYADLMSYVITHKNTLSTNQIIFTHENPCNIVKRQKQKDGKNIWICGGANLIQQLMQEDLIDLYYISVIPTILGDGIRLFATLDSERKLQLLGTHTNNGIIDLIYERR
jgi:dihydrofolate reductase